MLGKIRRITRMLIGSKIWEYVFWGNINKFLSLLGEAKTEGLNCLTVVFSFLASKKVNLL